MTSLDTGTCRNCGAGLHAQARFCENCGAEVPRGPTPCANCGAEVSPTASYCGNCGHQVRRAPEAEASGTWTAVAVGAIGVAATLTSIFTDDLVSGTDQTKVPVAVPVSLFWAAIGIIVTTATTGGRMGRWQALSVATIAAAVMLVSVASPNLEAGTDPTTVPIAMMSAWLWGTVAVILLAALTRRGAGPATLVMVAVIWGAVTLVSVLAPVLEAGTDPTEVPLAAMIAPAVGAAATPLVVLLPRR